MHAGIFTLKGEGRKTGRKEGRKEEGRRRRKKEGGMLRRDGREGILYVLYK
jgi:hypothetical protein